MAATTNLYQKLREKSGYSQSEFAIRLKVPLKSFQNWEQGVSEPHKLSRDAIIARAKKIPCKKTKK